MKKESSHISGKIADFHTHSNHSIDGTKSIKHILKSAHKNNVTMLGVTDHNTVSGVNKFMDKERFPRESVMELASTKTILVPGVEITARINEIKNIKGNSVKLHLLAYGIDRNDDSPISKLLKLKSINDHHVDLGFVYQLQKHFNLALSKQDVLDFFIHCKMNNHDVKAFGKEEAFNFVKFLGLELTENDEQLSEIISNFDVTDRFNLDVDDVINLVHASGGIVLLAHPQVSLRRTKYDKNVISYLIEHEIDGFELYYPQHTKTCDMYLRKVSKENNIHLHSAGSDYHDDNHNYEHDGFSIPYEPVTLDKVKALIDYLNEMKVARDEGTLILKNYKNLKDFNVEETLEKYRRRFCALEGIKRTTPIEEIEEIEL